jgi:hypothetical protein
MLCDVCKVRQATIFKAAPNENVSTVKQHCARIRHYCAACFERVFHKTAQAEELEKEAETPQTPVF